MRAVRRVAGCLGFRRGSRGTSSLVTSHQCCYAEDCFRPASISVVAKRPLRLDLDSMLGFKRKIQATRVVASSDLGPEANTEGMHDVRDVKDGAHALLTYPPADDDARMRSDRRDAVPCISTQPFRPFTLRPTLRSEATPAPSTSFPP